MGGTEDLARRLGLSAEALAASAFDGPMPGERGPELARGVRPAPGAAPLGEWLVGAGGDARLIALDGPDVGGLRRSARMAAVRDLAGRLGHELNNSLMALSGYSELLALDPSIGSDRGEVVGIRRAAERIAGLSRRMLQFSGRWAITRHRLAADSVARTLASRAAARLDGPLERDVGDLDGDVEVDLDALGIAIEALADNAREASPDAPVRFRAGIERLTGPEPLVLHPPVGGDFLRLTLTDGGPGVAPELLGRICEPMVTTHRERKAEGMGLPVVYGMLALHDGALALDCPDGGPDGGPDDGPAGGGLRVRLWLPLA